MYEVTLEGMLVPEPGETDADLDALTDRVMDALLDAGVVDPILSGSFATGDMSITVSIEADNPMTALSRAEQTVRSALTVAGAGVHDWDHIDVDRVPVPA
jgi:hypothetical protein